MYASFDVTYNLFLLMKGNYFRTQSSGQGLRHLIAPLPLVNDALHQYPRGLVSGFIKSKLLKIH